MLGLAAPVPASLGGLLCTLLCLWQELGVKNFSPGVVIHFLLVKTWWLLGEQNPCVLPPS